MASHNVQGTPEEVKAAEEERGRAFEAKLSQVTGLSVPELRRLRGEYVAAGKSLEDFIAFAKRTAAARGFEIIVDEDS